jgi:AAA domain
MGVSREDARRAKEKAQRAHQQGQPKPNGAAGPPAFLDGGTIGAQTVTWLWYPRLPASQISLLGSPGGGGKGLNGAHYAACVTTGRAWPCGSDFAPLGNVLWCETEDPLAEVVVPRLIAADADRSRVQFASQDAFAAAQDGLRAYILERSVKLIVLSPLISFLKGLVDINGELGVREVLQRLQASIAGTGCAAVGLVHTNKKSDLRAVERLLGTVAFTNFVRSVLLVGRDKQEPDWFRLVHAKRNLSAKAPDLLYRPKHVGQDLRDQFVKLEWRLPEHDVDPDSLFDRPKSNGSSAGPSAGQWLVAYLQEHGESLRADVVNAAEKAGFSEDTIRKAHQRNPRMKSRQDGYHGPYVWSLA